MRTHLALLLVSVLVVACDDGSPSAPEDVTLSFETVAQASYSGFTASQRRAVHGESDWSQVWQTLYAGQTPAPVQPAVDFDRETVLLAAAGIRNNGCYAIEITRASLKGNGILELEVTETVPGPACSCTEALTQPVHLVRVARVSIRETFVELRSQRRC